LLPSHGVSALDAEGQPFNDPSARQELFAAIQEHCGSIPCETISAHINDPEFAAAAAKKLLSLIPKT
jgi:uncharacterized protein (UPF0261 family)